MARRGVLLSQLRVRLLEQCQPWLPREPREEVSFLKKPTWGLQVALLHVVTLVVR